VRALASTPPILRLPVSTGLVHIPRRRPPDGERPVPDALRREWLAQARAVTPLAPSAGLAGGFIGLGDPNTVIPPDTHGAVGPSHLMVSLNSQVRFQNRSGASLVAPVTLDTFWVGGRPGCRWRGPRSWRARSTAAGRSCRSSATRASRAVRVATS
jgi:hypothetical protein